MMKIVCLSESCDCQGSSRSSLLGEATINLADYADALRPTSVALPLHGCEAILHVRVLLNIISNNFFGKLTPRVFIGNLVVFGVISLPV